MLSPGLLALDKQVRAAYSYPSLNQVLKALDQAMGGMTAQAGYLLPLEESRWAGGGGVDNGCSEPVLERFVLMQL